MDYERIKLLVDVAKRYYLNGDDQGKIAKELGISRASVCRILKECRENNIVTININDPLFRLKEVANLLKLQFNLLDVHVIPSTTNLNENKERAGKVAANALLNYLEDGSYLGVSFGTTLYEVACNLSPGSNKKVEVVQIHGGFSKTVHYMPTNAVAEKLAHAFFTTPHYLPAPAIVDSSKTREILLNENSIKRTLDLARKADVILMTVGGVDRSEFMARAGFLNENDLYELKKVGAVGETCGGQYYDSEGRLCDCDVNKRTIGITLEEIKGIPRIKFAVVIGRHKIDALYGALKGGIIDVLTVDLETATGILRKVNRLSNRE
jgi:deoxyribonucleoside regulator